MITGAQLARELDRIAADVVLVHSSLRAIAGGDYVIGGPVAVIEALLASDRTVVMPAFSADYSDPESWSDPPVDRAWWAEIRAHMPVWRRDRARTFRIGLIAEAFRTTPGVIRSAHPHSSFCAYGPRAAEILARAELDDPLGPDGPLGRLRAIGARVLLIGCGFGSCTSFHLAEHETSRPPPRVTSSAPVMAGERTWVRWSEPRYDASRFAEIGAELLAQGEIVTIARVGAARTYTFAIADAVAFATHWMDRGIQTPPPEHPFGFK